jgi:hypothetical protein
MVNRKCARCFVSLAEPHGISRELLSGPVNRAPLLPCPEKAPLAVRNLPSKRMFQIGRNNKKS